MYAGQAATANNLARCLLGAASSAAIIPMSEAVGRGWAYTILALLFVLSCIGPAVSIDTAWSGEGARGTESCFKNNGYRNVGVESRVTSRATFQGHHLSLPALLATSSTTTI